MCTTVAAPLLVLLLARTTCLRLLRILCVHFVWGQFGSAHNPVRAAWGLVGASHSPVCVGEGTGEWAMLGYSRPVENAQAVCQGLLRNEIRAWGQVHGTRGTTVSHLVRKPLLYPSVQMHGSRQDPDSRAATLHGRIGRASGVSCKHCVGVRVGSSCSLSLRRAGLCGTKFSCLRLLLRGTSDCGKN